MKTKLTITIDEALIPRAKNYARGQGLSLSQVIEGALSALASEESSTFSQRWRGKLRPAARDDDRYRALAERFL